MRLLVVAATAIEIAPLVASLSCVSEDDKTTTYESGGHRIDVLVTGVGMVATAAWLSRLLGRQRYDRAFNFGLCGSFDTTLPLGTVVHVVRDQLAELGAEDGHAFLSLQELNLGTDADVAFGLADGHERSAASIGNPALERLPQVTAITVNTVHGNDQSIAKVVRRVNPQVESMEGAAFMFTCAMHGVPHFQVRAVSNIVERRNRSAWRIPEAIQALGEAARAIIGDV